MRKYDFEYFNQKYTSKLVLFLFLSFLTLLFGSIFIAAEFLIKSRIIIMSCFILSIGLPFLIFRINRKNIKKQGSATIHDTYIEFNLDNVKREIKYNEINSYLIQNYNGTLLNMKLNDGEKFNVSANNTYCDTIKFDIFCQEFENVLEDFNDENNLGIVRKKSFFERKWIFPFLIILTGVFLTFILYALFTGKNFRISSFFIAFGSIITLWGGYLSNRNRNKK